MSNKYDNRFEIGGSIESDNVKREKKKKKKNKDKGNIYMYKVYIQKKIGRNASISNELERTLGTISAEM